MLYIIKNNVYNLQYRFCILSLQAECDYIGIEMRLTFRSLEALSEMCTYLNTYIVNETPLKIDDIMNLYEYLRGYENEECDN